MPCQGCTPFATTKHCSRSVRKLCHTSSHHQPVLSHSAPTACHRESSSLVSCVVCFYSDKIPCNAKKEIEHRSPTPFLFPFFYSGAGWSRATFHRQVEVSAFHHNLSLLSLLYCCDGGTQKGHVGVHFDFFFTNTAIRLEQSNSPEPWKGGSVQNYQTLPLVSFPIFPVCADSYLTHTRAYPKYEV